MFLIHDMTDTMTQVRLDIYTASVTLTYYTKHFSDRHFSPFNQTAGECFMLVRSKQELNSNWKVSADVGEAFSSTSKFLFVVWLKQM